MTDTKTPADHASDAAEAIRALNHATLSVPGLDWEYPSNAYSVIGGLERATGYLPQALDQIGRLLFALAASNSMGSTTGSAQERYNEADAALIDAREAAAQLNAALQRAHNATSPLTYED